MKIDEERIEKFTRIAINSYERDSIIDGAFDIHEFDEGKYGDLEYSQIVKRVLLPKRFFQENGSYVNSQIARDFSRAIYLGERNYALEKLKDYQQSSSVSSYTLDEFSFESLVSALGCIDNPKTMFLPLYFHEEVFGWVEKGKFNFRQGGEFLETPAGSVRLYWLPNDTGFENIFIIDSSESQIVQKRFGDLDMGQIDTIDEYQFSSPSDRLMVYFGESEDQENFDFLIRSVISSPIVDRNSVCVVDTSNTGIDLETDE